MKQRRLALALSLLAVLVAAGLGLSQTWALAQPAALVGVVVAASVALLAWREARRREAAHDAMAEPRLRRAMGLELPRGAALVRGLLLTAAVALLVVALARPKGQVKSAQIDLAAHDLMICLDVSRSMDTRDLHGESRLEVAKRLIYNLMGESAGDRLGLIAFAGSADVLCPFTLDHSVLEGILGAVDHTSVARQGTALGLALNAALECFVADRGGQAIILLTDGESHESDAVAAAQAAKARGIPIYTIGLGTAAGAVVPGGSDLLGRDVALRWRGREVVSRLDEAGLQRLAELSGGRYALADSPDRLREVLAEVRQGAAGWARQQLDARSDVFAWFVLPALLLLACEPLVRWRLPRRTT